MKTTEKIGINLDDLNIYKQYDPDDMLRHLHSFGSLCEQAWMIASNFNLPKEYSKFNKIVILGMGGSAIGGDLVNSLAASESKLPIILCRDYALPKYVDAGTLVIASSYSGMTEETLSAFEQSLETSARKLAITTGGKLRSICENKNIPVIGFDYKSSPRAALPFSFFIILGLLQKLNIFKNKNEQVNEALSYLKDLGNKINETIPLAQNPAKNLAKKLLGRLVVIYGAGITSEAAHRWKTQINENSKSAAYYEVFPELNHNAIVGYSLPEVIIRNTIVILLNSELLHERVKLRFQITQNLLQKAGIDYQVVSGHGKSDLSQMMNLVFLGDYVSYYLAMLNRVDPSPVKSIDFLKSSLAAH
jgi:glucose/mannose-6-phosphate isomerase